MIKKPYPSVGQLVLCIDGRWINTRPENTLPEKNHFYTIRAIRPAVPEDGVKSQFFYLKFQEILNPAIQYASPWGLAEMDFWAGSFRPVANDSRALKDRPMAEILEELDRWLKCHEVRGLKDEP